MKVALAQINPTVGDIAGNAALIRRDIERATSQGASLVVFPELSVAGYPPRDLLWRRAFVERNVEALTSLSALCTGITAIIGYVRPDESGRGTGLFNSAAVCRDGKIHCQYNKSLLPIYDVFDEPRYFNRDDEVVLFEHDERGDRTTIAVTICEDLWNDEQFDGRSYYGIDPIERCARARAQMLVNLSASPYAAGRQVERERIFSEQMKELRLPLVFVNQVGGNDDLIFDGGSFYMNAEGQVLARTEAFKENLIVVDTEAGGRHPLNSYPGDLESIRQALVLGLRDYVRKCGFSDVVIGLSGGIDSALTAALATEALGSAHVHGVGMPSRYSSDHSRRDAEQLACNLGIDYRVVPIEAAHAGMEDALRDVFADHPPDITEENVQARLRGVILMSMSNKFGWLVLATANKSEMATGYCTLYGDMCGALSVLIDVPKTTVYALAKHMNETAGQALIPVNSIEKVPSAELRPDQTDQQSLPPYDVLDGILESYLVREESIDAIIDRGFDRDVVESVVRSVDRNEYKRRQAPIGLRVTSRAFGQGRRMPVAAKFNATR